MDKWKDFDKRFEDLFNSLFGGNFIEIVPGQVNRLKDFVHSTIEAYEKKARIDTMRKFSNKLIDTSENIKYNGYVKKDILQALSELESEVKNGK